MDVRLLTDAGVQERSAGELPALLARTDGLVWVDIPGCDPEAVRVLSEVFGFHPLAVRDCLERNRVPKMHAYADHVFVVLHTPERGERGHVHYIELDQFVGRNYLVTVHGPINPAVDPEVALRGTSAVLARIEAGRLRPMTPFALSFAIVSALTRDQEEHVETVTSEVWQLEQRVTGGRVGDPEEFLNELFRARHGLLAVRTMGALGSAIYARMAALPGVSAEGRRLASDMADQLGRVRSVADGEREYLQGVIEFYQTAGSSVTRPRWYSCSSRPSRSTWSSSAATGCERLSRDSGNPMRGSRTLDQREEDGAGSARYRRMIDAGGSRLVTWLRRFIRAIVIGGDASELADLQRTKREREQQRSDEATPLRRRDGRRRR